MKKYIYNILIIIFLLGIVISIIKIILYKKDEIHQQKEMDEIINVVTIEEQSDNEENKDSIEIIEPVVEIKKEDPYWDYINMNLINVDFNNLYEKNKEVIGWLQVNGTNINYPFVQTNNNDYYLTHSFDKSYNGAGWVFMDYRNELDIDKNTIIYAHGMNNKTMFGSLRNILSSGWLNNTNNHVIKLSTNTSNTLWQVFSVYHIPTTNDYLKIAFDNDTKYKEFLDMLINRSQFNFNTTISPTDKILTLSTCYSKTDKVVLHAKLIKKENKN